MPVKSSETQKRYGPLPGETMKLPPPKDIGNVGRPKRAVGLNPSGKRTGFEPLSPPEPPQAITARPEPFTPTTWAGAPSVASNRGGDTGGDGQIDNVADGAGNELPFGFGGESGGAMPGGYAPGLYGEFWANPDALAQDFLAAMGITNPDMINVLAPLVKSSGFLDLILNMGDPSYDPSVANSANFVNDLLTQLTTPGGESLSPNALFEAMLSAEEGSPAWKAMKYMTPDELNNAMRSILISSVANPYAQRGYANAWDANARDYAIGQVKMDPSIAKSYYQQLQQRGALGGR